MPRQPKKPRTTRSGKPRLELTERDSQILLLIGTVGFLSSEQIAEEFFPSLDRCRRRLRQLFDAGMLFFFLHRADNPNLVRLTPEGLKRLFEYFPEYEGQIHLSGIIREHEIEKRLLLVDVRLFAVRHGETRGAPLTRLVSGTTVLAEELGLKEKKLSPAAIIEFSPPGESAFVAVELVEARGRLSTTWAKRLGRYYELAIAETLDGLWLVTASAKRAAELRSLVLNAALDDFARVLTKDELKRRMKCEAELSNPGRTVGSNPRNFDDSHSSVNSGCSRHEPGIG